MFIFAALIGAAALFTQEAEGQGRAIQVQVLTDGSLTVYHPSSRELIVYRKTVEEAQAARRDAAIELARAQVALARQRQDVRNMFSFDEKLAEIDKKMPVVIDPTYHCIARYQIPADPAGALASIPCPPK